MTVRHRQSKNYDVTHNAVLSYPEVCPDRVEGLDTKAIYGRIAIELKSVSPVPVNAEIANRMRLNAGYSGDPVFLCATDPFTADTEPVYVSITRHIVTVITAERFREFHDTAQATSHAVSRGETQAGRPFPVGLIPEIAPVPDASATPKPDPGTDNPTPSIAAPKSDPDNGPPLSVTARVTTLDITRLIRACTTVLEQGQASIRIADIEINFITDRQP